MLFDPDADEPAPLSPDGWQAGFEQMRQAAVDAGVEPAYVAAWQDVGYVVTDENRHLFSAAEVQAYLDAVGRHQQPPLPDRPLPGDLFAVELSVRHRRAWSADPDEELDTWHVSADIFHEDDDLVVTHVGDMRFLAVNLYETGNAPELLAAEDGDVSIVWSWCPVGVASASARC